VEFEGEIVAVMKRLRAFALRLSMNSATADDLVQETICRALEKREQFIPGSNLFAWLCTILKNHHVERYRRRTKREVLDPDGAFSAHLRSVDNQLDALLARETIAELLTSKHDYVTAVCLKAMGDSIDDIAVKLNIPAGTVKSRVSRGRTALSESMGEVA
jgi:RNA polymerase sigma-70 factor, ECF subfamily